jgi:uroporphyrinogen-III synthase
LSLSGLRVAVLEARRSAELAELVRRRGGEPFCAPAVSEEPAGAAEGLAGLLEGLGGAADPVVIFTTGVGFSALLAAARQAGREGELRALLGRATLACRGPKPVAALAREGLRAALQAEEPFTEAELLAALQAVPLAGRTAALVHHGERSTSLAAALAARGAHLREVTPYRWAMPADRGPLRAAVEELAAGRIGAVLFTSQVQARHLFAVAEELGRAAELRAALGGGGAVVGSVGPTCTLALEALGVHPQVTGLRPKMGSLVAALEQHLSQARSTS